MDSDAGLKACIEVPFEKIEEANIVWNSLKVDKEPSRSRVNKVLSIEDKKLIVKFSAPGARELRTAISSFMDLLILVIETIARFGPPVSKEYSYL